MVGLPIKLEGLEMLEQTVDFNKKYKIIETKNNSDNLVFYYAVKTTGIFCKPGCSSRLPKVENISFFETTDEAIKSGFRPCKRCRPLENGINKHEQIILNICRYIEKENSGTLDFFAKQSGYSERHLQRIFKDATGISPKEYLIAVRENNFRKELQGKSTITESIYNAGFNSVSGIYENTNDILAMKPNQFKKFGDSLKLYVGLFQCSLGSLVISFTDLGISSIDIGDNSIDLLNSFNDRFKNAVISELSSHDYIKIKDIIDKIDNPNLSINIPLDIHGTVFQKKVWKCLLNIPIGTTMSYSEVAQKIGEPKSFRAVANACGKNNISILIPCHRVVGKKGNLSGYKWGKDKKQQILDYEREFKKVLIEQELMNRVFHKLAIHYGDINREVLGEKKSWWPAKDPFEMMVGAILTQNTNWKNVELAISNFKCKLTPSYISKVDLSELSDIIKPSGYHNQKAKKLKNLCNWFKRYNYDIAMASIQSTDKLRAELLEINGVGFETADSILVYALNKTSFVIDAYTRRIFSRVGVDVPLNYNNFKNMIESSVTSTVKIYDYYHGLIIEHAKAFCKKQPLCDSCILSDFCKYNISL